MLTNYIPKQLLYYFYIDSYEVYDVYKLHLECIKLYGDIFFKYTFILSVNNTDDNELINYWKSIITDYIGSYKHIDFIVVENNKQLREGIHYYNYVYKRLKEFDGLICYGHGKRDFEYDKNDIYQWIAFSHYIMSHDIKDVENKLIYDKYLFVGPFKSFLEGHTNINQYTGSFYWMNPKKIYNMFKENIETFIYYVDNYFKRNSYNHINHLGNNILYCIAEQNNLMKTDYMYHYQSKLIPMISFSINHNDGFFVNNTYEYTVIKQLIDNYHNENIINNFNIYYSNLINKLNINLNE